jgi:hypothetical protein
MIAFALGRKLLNTPVDLATHRKSLSVRSAFVPNIAISIPLIGKGGVATGGSFRENELSRLS